MSGRKLYNKYMVYIIPLLLALVTVVACLCYTTQARRHAEERAYRVAMDSAAEQNRLLSATLDGRFTTLEVYARLFSEDENFSFDSQDTISRLGPMRDGAYALDLFVADLSGVAHIWDGTELDVSERRYFRQAVSGSRVIDHVGSSHISNLPRFVFAVPLERAGEIIGAVCARVDVDTFRDLLTMEAYERQGYAFICDSEGDIIIATAHPLFSEAQNVFDVVNDKQIVKGSDLARLKEDLRGGQAGYTVYTRGKDARFAVYCHTGVNDWTLFQVLPDTVIAESVAELTRSSNAVTIIIAALSIAMLMFVYVSQKRGMEVITSQRRDFRAAATQSGRMLHIYDVKGGKLISVYREDSLTWADSPEEMVRLGNVAPESADAYLHLYNAMREGQRSGTADVRLKDAGGEFHWYRAEYTLMRDEQDKPDHAVVTLFDNTAQMEKELAYELRQSELAALMESSVFYLEANLMTGRVETSHGATPNLAAFDGEQGDLYALVEWDARTNVYPDDAARFREFFDKNRLLTLHTLGVASDRLEFRSEMGGKLAWSRVTVQMVKSPNTDEIKVYVVFHNVDEEYLKRERLLGLAAQDSLTGLLNRESTMQEIERFLHAEGADGTHALYMVDIDNFKQVNDTLGHQVGDGVLADLAETLRGCFRKEDIVGRVGGDEFFAFMKDAGVPGLVRNKARELTGELQYIYAERGVRVDLSASIGVTVYHGKQKPVKTLSVLYAEADAALYKAKTIGKNGFAFADELDAAVTEADAPAVHGGAYNTLALNLRNLLNNLGGGIEIYHQEEGGSLTPLVCNESFLQLLGGLTEAEYRSIYGEDAFGGVHPEELEEVRRDFEEARREGRQYQKTCRLKGKHGGYYWVTVTMNCVRSAGGGWDVYAVYADAEQTIRRKADVETRYSAFLRYRHNAANKTVSTFRLDLSGNRCLEAANPLRTLPETWVGETAEAFFAAVGTRIDKAWRLPEFQAAFSPERLIACFRLGEAPPVLDLPMWVEEDRMLWLRVTVEMAENPDSRAVEALVHFMDVDKEIRLQYILRGLLHIDYEFMFQVDLETGRMTVFGESVGAEAGHASFDGANYREMLPEALRGIVRDEFYEESVAALELDHLIAMLDKTDTFVCAFPTKARNGKGEGFCQWRCAYIGERRRVIMLSRKDVTDTMAGELDAVTGLFNQQGFYRRVRERLDESPETPWRILRFDLDNFKVLNDALGFDRCDALLRDIGAAMQTNLSNRDAVMARLEADHFAFFLPRAGNSAEAVMEKIKQWLERYPLDYPLWAHMGVYHIDEPEAEVSVMCDRALLALKSVKQSFSQRVGYYNESLREKLLREQALVSEMEQALATGQFEVYFQPQYNYENGALIGAEALVRWNHPERGLISPGLFIPLFESNGFITSLDEYIWEKSCQYLRKWLDAADTYMPISIAVNISRMDIYNQRLLDTLKRLTAKYDLPVSMLKLEITESAYMENPEQLMRVVAQLHNAGFIIEMDDFGSGWSSLNTLKDVPVDTLKLDMRFLSNGLDDQRGGNILSSVIRMAHWLKIPVIAEGVETKEQADYLKSLGCLYMQGYHFARPMPAEQFEAMLAASRLGAADQYVGTDLTGVAAFWDPSAQTALLFNSFVGGAAILEYRDGSAEILRANDKFYQELETTRQAYLEKQLNTLARFEGVHRVNYQKMLDEAARTGGEAECDVLSLPQEAGGRRYWTHTRVRLLAKNVDTCLFYLAVENITERKALEEQIRAGQEALRLSISQTGRIICGYDIESHELTLPAEYAQKYGLPLRVRDIHLGHNAVIEEDKGKFRAFYERLHRGAPDSSALVRVRQEGAKREYGWEQLDAVTIYDDEGKPERAVITCRDVTAEREQDIERAHHSLIIENTGICVVDYDAITDTIRFQTVLQGGRPQTVEVRDYLARGLDLSESRVHPEDKPAVRALLRELIDGEPATGSLELRVDGWGTGRVWCRFRYISLADDLGRVYRVLGQNDNIQREKDEAALLEKLDRRLDIRERGLRFNVNIAERVFTLLYGTDMTARSIDLVLAALGEHYDLSRAYIIEENADGASCSNTFEWCAPGITPEIGNLQNVSYAEDLGGSMFSAFDENGVLLCRDISMLPAKHYEVAARQGIRSMLQCAILHEGVPVACIAYDECREYRDWTEEQVGTLLLVSRIIGAFLTRLRKTEQAEFSVGFRAALDEEASFVYIVDPETYEIRYGNKAIRRFFGHEYHDSVCYREFAGRQTPCEVCPIRARRETGAVQAVEVLRADGMPVLAQASPMHWNGREMYMVSGIDISERHALRRELENRAASIQALCDSLPCGITQYIRVDGAWKLSHYNTAAWRLPGYADEESFLLSQAEGGGFANILPEELPLLRERFTGVSEEGVQADFEHRVRREDGGLIWVRTIMRKTKDLEGTDCVQSVFVDITARKQNYDKEKGYPAL